MPASRLPFIQALRGVAVLLVMFYHYRMYIDGGAFVNVGTRLFEPGALGVDLFFILSGFIMVYTTADAPAGPKAAGQFLLRRAVRIWPPYVVWTLVMVAATRGIPNPAFAVSWEMWVKTLTFQPYSPGSAAPFFGYPVLYVGWSLVFEVYFYIVFAISLCAGRWRLWVLFALLGTGLVALPLVTVGQLHFDALRRYPYDSYLHIVTSPFLWEFIAGALIALVTRSRIVIADRGIAATVVVLAAGAVTWQYFSGVYAGHGPTRWGPALIALVAALALYDKSHPIRPPRWLEWVGDISYSLYLVHVIPTMLVRHTRGPLTQGGGYWLACIIVSFVAAYWSHRLLEQRFGNWLRRGLSPKPS